MAQKPVQEDLKASRTSVSAENKRQPTMQEKKAALREIPDNTNPSKTPVCSKDKVSTSDSSANKITGTKRPNPSSPASPLTYTYVRRKLDTEQGKANGSPVIKEEATKEKTLQNSQEVQVVQNVQLSQESQKLQNINEGEVTKVAKPQDESLPNVIMEMKVQNESPHEEMSKATKPQNGVSEVTNEQNGSQSETREDKPQNGNKGEDSGITKQVPSSVTANQDWKERFIRLQGFLKNCDRSNQEDYMRMLRSLTAVGRSKQAIELEKRAIHLLLEEGKELHRMKVMNVLGKGSPSDPSLYLPQLASPPARLLQR